jgi:hypothetical protein
MNEEQLSKKCANLIGQKFNRLTVLELDHIEHKYIPSKHGYSQRPYWKCKCDCGNITIASSTSLKGGCVKSCGCYKLQRIREVKHKTNQYDLTSHEYGIGYTTNDNIIFYFDKSDYDLIHDYCWVNDGRYISTTVNNKTIRLHNLIMPNVSKEKGIYVDHINRNRYDNRRCNLRYVNPTENARNTSKSKANTSGIIGVWWSNKDNYWVAQINYDGKTHTIPTSKYMTFEQVVKLRLEAEITYFGKEFAPQRHLFKQYGIEEV